MSFNPNLVSLLESYTPERLRAILLWLYLDSQKLSQPDERLNAMLEDVHTLDVTTCYQSLETLALDDLVDVSLLSEFGTSFSTKPGFQWLHRAMSHRLASHYAML